MDREALAREIIKLHKDFLGRGPTRSQLLVNDDMIVMVMAHGHTTGEETLRQSGAARRVAQSRVDMSEQVSAQFIAVVERLPGRRVVGFMTSSQQDPDLLSHVYVLDSAGVLGD